MSRLMIETIKVYGTNFCRNNLCGPFFCGISPLKVLQEFSIRLFSPTSTTKSIEVAETFAGYHGMIMQLNTNGSLNGLMQYTKAFCTSWISNYSSEDEYLFCGGLMLHSLRVETIITSQTSQNFAPFFRALFYFHSILTVTNVKTDTQTLTKKDYEILQDLSRCHRGRHDGINLMYPKYIHNTFDAFLNHMSWILGCSISTILEKIPKLEWWMLELPNVMDPVELMYQEIAPQYYDQLYDEINGWYVQRNDGYRQTCNKLLQATHEYVDEGKLSIEEAVKYLFIARFAFKEAYSDQCDENCDKCWEPDSRHLALNDWVLNYMILNDSVLFKTYFNMTRIHLK
eukprot:266926_1